MVRLGIRKLDAVRPEDSQINTPDAPSDLCWWVTPLDREAAPYQFDLTKFASDSGGRHFNLLCELVPHIKTWTHSVSEHTSAGALVQLRVAWQFLDHLETLTGEDIDSVANLTDAHGVMLRSWLLHDRKFGPAHSGAVLKFFGRRAEEARYSLGINPSLLNWPIVRQPQVQQVDIDPSLSREIYNALKAQLRLAKAKLREGELLVKKGVDPRGCAIEAWHSRENVAFLTKLYVEQALSNPGTQFRQFVTRNGHAGPKTLGLPINCPSCLERRLQSGASCVELRPTDRIGWFVPMKEDVVAALALVLLHTGWNAQVALSMTVDDWYEWRLKDDDAKSNSTVVLFGRNTSSIDGNDPAQVMRGRKSRSMGQQIISHSLTKPEFHPYRVIKWLISATAPLRSALKLQLEQSRKGPSSQEKARECRLLEKMIRSPWLYWRRVQGHAVGGQVGSLTNGYTSPCDSFQKVLRDHGVNTFLKPRGSRRTDSERHLTLSDLRDGYVSFLYEKSMGDILLIQRALGHRRLSSTRHYLQQRQHKEASFRRIAELGNAVFSELVSDGDIDPTILHLSANFGCVSQEQRKKVFDLRERTRVGMGCRDPEHPPEYIAPYHQNGQVCAVQRCIMCPLGIVFDDSFTHLALRGGELLFLHTKLPVDRWNGSSFEDERIILDASIVRNWPNRYEEFETLQEQFCSEINQGIRPAPF